MSRVIVERTFPKPLTAQELEAVGERMAPCLKIYNVRWIRSFWSMDHLRMVCEYEAADAESVRAVQREAAAAFDRVWAADVVTPATEPSLSS